MDTFLMILLFAVGIGLVVKGSDVFVDASVWISDVSGISKAVIGATLVSLATTAPEHLVSVISVVKGSYALSVGNAVGSMIVNLGVAFALLALFARGKTDDKLFGVKGLIMIASAGLLLLLSLNGVISVWEACVLLAVYAAFTFINIRYSRDKEVAMRKPTNKKEIIINVLKFVLGITALVFGANLMVDNAQKIAAALGVSEAIIGLTVVAVGTSLPEIATSVTAIAKKQNSLSIGNIVGANIADATLILATSAFAGGKLLVSGTAVSIDLPVVLLLALVAVVPPLLFKKTFRWQGFALLGLYALYVVYLIVAQT
jgi:cation:H+ antiporter